MKGISDKILNLMFSYSEDQKSQSQSYIFFANNIFALLRGIITIYLHVYLKFAG